VNELADPGWKPSVPVAVGIVRGRGATGSILLVMRAAVLLLSVVSGLTAVAVLVFGAGSGEVVINSTVARMGISAVVGAAVFATSFIGRAGPDLSDESVMAVSLFQITMRRVLAAAAVGPAGLIFSWLSADASYVIFGAGLAMLLMAVASPTARRIEQWETEVEEAGSDLSVRSALNRPWR
jgi:hypothetical protein